eukprot:g5602.t1
MEISTCGRMRRVALLGAAALWGWAEVGAKKPFHHSPSISLGSSEHERATNRAALLLEVNERNLRPWANYAELHQLPPIWVVCAEHDTGKAALVEDMRPNLRALVVEEDTSWATVFRRFRVQSDSPIFGLLGEGVLPPEDLVQAISSIDQALTASDKPTAVLTRSRSGGDAATPPEWLPDTFISQVWCNLAMMTGTGLDDEAFQDSTLLQILPKFIRAHRVVPGAGPDLVLVDGTSFMPSVFDLDGGGRESTLVGNVAAADGGNLYFGMMDLALVRAGGEDEDGEGGGGAVSIGTAPWPPVYVLENVVSDSGLVLVNNVNCGYLDFATNFLLAARKVSDAKVLWVAMDETAFDFMDNLAPGCAAMYPSEGSERHHAIKAGRMGDDTFKSQVLIRPNMLLHILKQGYTLLWTDSDMVWLENPLPVLPDMDDPEAAELMLQLDGSRGNPCTCFMFMKPTVMVKELLVKWMQSIVDADSWYEDQIPFKGPLHEQRDAGMRLDYFPEEWFPSGKHFFENPYEENYARIHYEHIMIVHDNYIKGHDSKRGRFEEYHLWDIGNNEFPLCER